MRYGILFLFLSFTFQLFSQESEKCQPATPFERVLVYDGIIATIVKGAENKICPGEGSSLEDFNLSFQNNSLRVRKVSGKSYENKPRILIVYKTLSDIEGYNDAAIDTKDTIRSESFRVNLNTGASLYASFNVNHLKVNLSEGALLKASGKANTQEITSVTNATFSGFELQGTEGEIKTNTWGKAKVNISKKLLASAKSGGFISFMGSPRKETQISLGGKITPYSEE